MEVFDDQHSGGGERACLDIVEHCGEDLPLQDGRLQFGDELGSVRWGLDAQQHRQIHRSLGVFGQDGSNGGADLGALFSEVLI